MSDSPDRDVFVSYRHGDPTKTWVRTVLVPALEADGLSVVLDQRDFVQGDSLIDQMEAAATRARVTIAVVDHRYRDSDYTMFESTVSSKLIVVVRGELDAEQVPPGDRRVDLGGSDDPQPVVDEVNDVLKRVFVLGAQEDDAWIEGVLIPELERAGVSARRASELAGRIAATAFERAVQHADKVVVVLSGAYYRDLADEHSPVAQAGRVVGDVVLQKKVVPVRRDPADFDIEPRYTRDLIIDATNDELWDDAIEAICRLLEVEAPGPPVLPPCPYPGMQPFGTDDHDVFFGRRELVTKIHERLRSYRFATVIGPSGSGKSSLVLAGVLPGIRSSNLGDLRHDRVEVMRPRADPMSQLADALQRLQRRDGDSVEDAGATDPSAGRPLLVIDQFEEVFAPNVTSRSEFFAELERIVDDELVSVIVTVRADFTGNLMETSMWQQRFAPSRVEVTPLTGDSLREAIVEPAASRRVRISPALVERLVAETDGEPGLLPFLQVSLRRTWAEMRVHYMTIDAYERAGAESDRSGVRQAISQQAEDALAQVKVEVGDEPGELLVRRMLLRMIQSGQGGRTTRGQVDRAELTHISDETRAAETAIDVLDRYRIVTIGERTATARDRPDATDGEGEGDGDETAARAATSRTVSVIDLSHEAIIEGWPTLANWIEQFSALEISGRPWSERAREHRAEVGSLLTGRDLDRAEDWIAEAESSLLVDSVVRDYVNDSRADSDARAASSKRNRRLIGIGGAVLAAAIVMAAIVSFVLWRSAESARQQAEREADQRVATQLRTSASSSQGGLSIQSLLIRAADVIDPSESSAIEMLTTAERDPPIAVRIDATERGVGFDAGLLLDDGRFVIGDGLGQLTVRPRAGSSDGGTGAVAASIELGRTVLALEPIHGTTFVAAAGGNASPIGNNTFLYSDGGVDLIDLARVPLDRTPVEGLSDQPVSSLVHRDDLLVAGDWGGEVLVIDVADPARPGRPRSLEFPKAAPTPECPVAESERSVRGLAIDDDGRWLAAALSTCQIAIWEWPSLTPLVTIGGHTDQVRAIDFVPGSSELLSTGNDRSIRSSDPDERSPASRVLVASAGGRTSATGSIGEGRVTALCVARDGGAVMTAGRDHLVRRWVRTDSELRSDQTQLESHSTTIRSLECLTDGRVLSTAADSVVLWDLSEQVRSGISVGGLTDVRDVAVRPSAPDEVAIADGGQLLMLGRSDQPRLPDEVRELSVGLVEFSPGGDFLAVAGSRPGGFADRLVVLDAESLSVESVVDSNGDGRLWSLAVTDDGRALAGMNEGELLDGGQQRAVTVPTGRRVTAVAVSVEGHLVVGDIGGALMCGAVGGDALRTVELGRAINDVDIDDVSGTVAVGTAAGLAQVHPDAIAGVDPTTCDPGTWRRSSSPSDHDVITSVDTANGGEILVSANSDGNAEVWDAARLRLVGWITLPDGHPAEHVAIDPEARTLVVAGGAAAIVFEVDRDELRQRLCEIAGRDMSADEEAAFLSDPRYHDLARCTG